MNKPAQRAAGFTLIELLITLALFVIVGLVVNDLLRLSVLTGAAANARSNSIQDAQMAQQIIAGRISEAIYVYNDMTASDAAAVLSSGGVTTQNTVGVSGGQRWRVKYDPFIAMILPPRTPGGACSTQDADDTTASSNAGCYRFFAYYAVSRTTLTNSGLAASQKPSVDASNTDKWALMEYRASLYSSSSGAWTPLYDPAGTGAITDVPGLGGTGDYFNGRSGKLLLDYVLPNSAALPMFDVTLPSAAGQPTGSVKFLFNTSRRAAGTTQTANPVNDPLGATVNPRNWVCRATTPTTC